MTEDDVSQQKSIEYFSAGVAAWYNTALEHDKSIFSLSAGGIGLLVTLLTTGGPSTSVVLGLYIAAIASFLVSLVTILIVFRLNRSHIEKVLKSTGPDAVKDQILSGLDLLALVGFGLGALFAAAIGIAAAVSSYEGKVRNMAIENKSQGAKSSPLNESFNGIKNLQPQTDNTKSFNGIGNLKPQATPTASAPAAPAPAASTPAQQPAGSGPTK